MDNQKLKTTPPDTQVCKCCGRELPIENFANANFGRRKTCNECMAQKIREGRKKRSELAELQKQISEARGLRLKDFQPRELMIELKNRGYEGKLVYTQRYEIDITKVD